MIPDACGYRSRCTEPAFLSRLFTKKGENFYFRWIPFGRKPFNQNNKRVNLKMVTRVNLYWQFFPRENINFHRLPKQTSAKSESVRVLPFNDKKRKRARCLHFLPKISFLLEACGSAVYDHSKSVLDTCPPILMSPVKAQCWTAAPRYPSAVD